MKRIVLLLLFVMIELLAVDIPAGSVSGVWLKSLSPYVVKGDIVIPNGSSLVIEHGVVVIVDNSFKITVSGSLKANGLSTDSITFTASNPADGWGGFVLNTIDEANDSTLIEYTSVRYAKKSTNGGAVFCDQVSKLRISDCFFERNFAQLGGSLYLIRSNAIILRNKFRGNTTSAVNGKGGAMYVSAAYNNMFISNNIFSDNSAGQYGGAIYLEDTNTNLTKNTINNNSALFGGGIAAINDGSSIANNRISGNVSTASLAANSGGGGVFLKKSNSSTKNITISGNVISDNRADNAHGGGVFCQMDGVVAGFIVNNLISGNSAKYDGGGVYISSSCNYRFYNNTVVNNSATTRNGGGLFLNGYLTNSIANSIIFNNSAISGGQIYLGNSNSKPNISYSNIQGGQTAFGLASGVTFNGTYTSNIDADPLFTSTGNHPYSIQATSPCKNAGTPDTTGLKLPLADLAGFARMQEGRVDIGAYEYGTVLDIGSSAQKKSPVIVKSYPNPFNNQTQINFVLGNNAMVNLSVYNAAGQKVKHLLSSVLSAGEHSIGFNADNLNTGVYFVRLKTADFSTETKVVLTK